MRTVFSTSVLPQVAPSTDCSPRCFRTITQRISSQLTIVPLTFKQILYKQGEVIQHVFFPGGGACSLTRVMRNGQIAEIATIGNEGVIGASVFFGDDQSFSETIVQVADGDGFKCRSKHS